MPEEDCTHQMQLRIDGVWSISNRNWNNRSFLFPAKEEGDVNTYEVTMTHTCVSVDVFRLNTQKFGVRFCTVQSFDLSLYLKVEQEARILCPSCPRCLMTVMGSLGIPDTGSYWTGSLSQCMQAGHRNMQCAPEADTLILIY